MLNNNRIYKYAGLACVLLSFTACKLPAITQKDENKNTPAAFNESKDTTNTSHVKWKNYFTDPNLEGLINTALQNNQELNITLQEIEIARNEIKAKKGEYLPFVGLGAGAGFDKSSTYTTQGATEAANQIVAGKNNPTAMPNYMFGANVSWEVDIWKKLRNAKKAAVNRYLGTVEGKNFMVTNLISEIANSYYELMALDNELDNLKMNISIQQNALNIVKLEKVAAKVTELAVRKFEAEVLKNQSRQFYIAQQITITENKINFLVGRFPQPVARDSKTFSDLAPVTVKAGLPSQLLANRPDIRQAEQILEGAKLDVKIAKAQFYPSLRIDAGLGYQAFNPAYLMNTPESLIYGLAGSLTAPLINRNGIKAAYMSASARQLQAVYNYERSIVNGYIEVANQLAMINNLNQSYDLKVKQVAALTESIDISTKLFTSARADYMEVLLTQRDALEARMELIETKKRQMSAMVNVYRALGGGWN